MALDSGVSDLVKPEIRLRLDSQTESSQTYFTQGISFILGHGLTWDMTHLGHGLGFLPGKRYCW